MRKVKKSFMQCLQIKGFNSFLAGLFIMSTFLMPIANANEDHPHNEHGQEHSDTHAEHEDEVKGPHGGRLLSSGDFSLELLIYEIGVPAEYRAWTTLNNQPLAPVDVDLNIKLTRLSTNAGGLIDDIKFKSLSDGDKGDALRGDRVVAEPHSFVVNIRAIYKGKEYTWSYDSFEGRTKIENAVAKTLAIETTIAGPVVIHETIDVYGKIIPNTEKVSQLSARFPGVIKSVKVSMGDAVKKGQTLATVESNESLKLYSIKSPINGVITQRNANPGQQTGNDALFVITDNTNVWVDLSIFPKDISRVKKGAKVNLELTEQDTYLKAEIAFINLNAEANQSVTARVIVNNEQGKLFPGSYIKAKVVVAEHAVPLAVKRTGLQAFRDFTVVYEKIDEEYEVRMLELGKQDKEWVEVLSGLQVGARYVFKNSYVVKADIEKSGAAHDH